MRLSIGGHVAVFVVLVVACDVGAGDWPQWRYDAGRTAAAPERLPEKLHLQWQRQSPPLRPAFWQVRQERVQFDLGYEPVVEGKTLVVGSSRNDSVTALDTDTGAEKWRFYADGPVRLAPALGRGKVYAASDDGCLYCLDAGQGTVLWKRRAAPSARKVLGNGRLISAWPARGGPVVADGTVYFAAGVWPFEGIFIYALDAETGRLEWVNDRCGSLYLEHPHAAMSFGGPSPQGYLLVRGEHLIVPSSRAFPAFFDRKTGRLASFDFGHGGHGSRPGGWFVATGADGSLRIDPEINTEIHDAGRQIIGQTGVRREPDEPIQEQVTVGDHTYRIEPGLHRAISAGGKTYRFSDGFDGVEGEIHTMLAADGKLFVVTRSGSILCFGPQPIQPRRYDDEGRPGDGPTDEWTHKANEIVEAAGARTGVALVWGLRTGRLVEELIGRTDLHVVAVDRDARRVDALRRRLDRAGVYGRRASVHQGDPLSFGFPPYLATLIVSEHVDAAAIGPTGDLVERAFESLRPWGGAVCLELPADEHEVLAGAVGRARLGGAELQRRGRLTLLVRSGPPPGAANYTGSPNHDEQAKGPFGLLWFGDTFHRHKLFYRTFYHETGRGLPTNIQVVDGVMKYEVTEEPYGPNPKGMGYHEYLRFLEANRRYLPAYVDVYTGRVLSRAEVEEGRFPPVPATDPDRPDAPWTMPLPRRNPLTGIVEGRAFLKTYGCDRTPVDYGHLVTMRSGTAAYYDKRLESGTVNVSGTRSGCRNSIVPACGVLSLPSWTGNCTCNYPVFTSLALAPMPDSFEQWSAWGGVAVEAPIERAGINFGAPGDRVDGGGTLWLDFPSVGGPSPEIPIRVTPEEPTWYYRHALWMEEGGPRPWVTASGVKGMRTATIVPVARRSGGPGAELDVRWAGAIEPEHGETYTFHVRADGAVRLWIDDRLVLDSRRNVRRGSSADLTGSVALRAGAKAGIKMEYSGPTHRGDGQPATLELCWSSPSVTKCVIPGKNLFTLDGRPGGLSAAYSDGGPSGPSVLRVDSQVSFDWSKDLPVALAGPAEPVEAGGVYTVELFFAEPDGFGPGERVFSVALQGREVLANLDVSAEAGGAMRGLVKRFEGVRVDKELTIAFTPIRGEPVVSGVRIEREGGPR